MCDRHLGIGAAGVLRGGRTADMPVCAAFAAVAAIQMSFVGIGVPRRRRSATISA